MSDGNIQIIDAMIEGYAKKIQSHPISVLANSGRLPKHLLALFAEVQLGDSNTWLGMLATALGKVSTPRLKEALRSNIACEAGFSGTPHPILAADFAASLGVTQFRSTDAYWVLQNYNIEASTSITTMTEGEIAGWLLAQESLVPELFKLMRPAFIKVKGVDMTYLDEHVLVDADEHAQWMREGIIELMQQKPGCMEQIVYGMELANRVTMSVPDMLYCMAQREIT